MVIFATGLPWGAYAICTDALLLTLAWAVCWGLAVALRPHPYRRRYFLSWATVWLAGWLPAAGLWYWVVNSYPGGWQTWAVFILAPCLPLIYGMTRRQRYSTKLGQWRWSTHPALALVLGGAVWCAYLVWKDSISFSVWLALRNAVLVYLALGPVIATGAVLLAELRGGSDPDDSDPPSSPRNAFSVEA